MGKDISHWYLKGIGYFVKAECLEDGTYAHSKIYNHMTKKWVADKEKVLFQCLSHRLPGCEAEIVIGGHRIHELEQIDGFAFRFAEDAHEGQFDEDGLPAIEHPKAVAARLDNPFEKAIAYLHDVVEDTDVTIEDIKRAFGDAVAERINLLTYHKEDDYVNDYLWCITDDPIASKVKLVDLIHNLERDYAHPEKDNEKRIRKHEGGVLYLLWYWMENGDEQIAESLSEIVYSASNEIQDFVFGHL